MLFEGLYHPPNITPDGMRGRGGEGRGGKGSVGHFAEVINFDWVFGT